jgi:ABC-type transport system involved in multi-copper enzyme maturation permease subunit
VSEELQNNGSTEMASPTSVVQSGGPEAIPAGTTPAGDGAPKRQSWLARLFRSNTPKDPVPRPPLYRRLARSLNPLSIAANIPGPIFQKEVWISGRKAGTYWGRALFAAGLLGFVTLVFCTTSLDTYAIGPAQRLQAMQNVAPSVFTTVLIFQFIALALAGCILGAPAICEEKRAGTLGTLLTTPLKAWQIVVGKTSAFFVQILILALIATPLLLAIRIFGGLTAQAVIASASLSLSTALLAGLLGLLHSISAKRTPSAILGALVSLVASQSITPLVFWLLEWRGHNVSWFAITYACTPAALIMVAVAQVGAPIPGFVMQYAWLGSTGFNLALCVITLIAASWKLRRAMAREAEGGSTIPRAKKPKGEKQSQTPAVAGDPQAATPAAMPPLAPGTPPVPRKKRRTIAQPVSSRTVSDNPVLWRELRQAAFRSSTQMIISATVFVVGLAVLYWRVGLNEEGLHATVGIVAVLAALCVAAVSTTSGISGERESRTWEALLATPLSARQIVTGKFMGALRRQWFIPALVALHFAAATVYFLVKHEGFDPAAVPFLGAILAAPVIALSGTGVLFSLLCRKSTVAAVCNFGLALAAWVGAPIIALIVDESFGRGSGNHANLVSSLCCINPVAMAVVALGGGLDRHYDLFDWGNVGVGAFTWIVLGYLLFFCALGLFSIKLAASILAARSLRRA